MEKLRRFLGNASRKITYAPPLVEAIDPSAIPRPLVEVLAHARNALLRSPRPGG